MLKNNEIDQNTALEKMTENIKQTSNTKYKLAFEVFTLQCLLEKPEPLTKIEIKLRGIPFNLRLPLLTRRFTLTVEISGVADKQAILPIHETSLKY